MPLTGDVTLINAKDADRSTHGIAVLNFTNVLEKAIPADVPVNIMLSALVTLIIRHGNAGEYRGPLAAALRKVATMLDGR